MEVLRSSPQMFFKLKQNDLNLEDGSLVGSEASGEYMTGRRKRSTCPFLLLLWLWVLCALSSACRLEGCSCLSVRRLTESKG